MLGGGESNTIMSDHGTIVGGLQNTIGNSPFASGVTQHCVIAGGCYNLIDSSYSGTIGGGCGNTAMNYGTAITGGVQNIAKGYESFVGGGSYNTIDYTSTYGGADFGTIGGGYENKIEVAIGGGYPPLDSAYQAPHYGTVAGGGGNGVYEDYGAIGGGNANRALGMYSNIPGGNQLVALDYQTVVGYFNEFDTGAAMARQLQGRTGLTAPPNTDDKLFIVGNGKGAADFLRSNAFTVSHGGYSSAYDNIGSGGGTGLHPHDTATRIGTMYASNTIVAWGNVVGGSSNTFDDIGVDSIHWWGLHTGHYTITLNVVNQDGTPHKFVAGDAAITVSLGMVPLVAGGMITVTPLTGGTAPTFDVYTSIPTSPPAYNDDYGFQFHVVAR
jgi:hypothetical protein